MTSLFASVLDVLRMILSGFWWVVVASGAVSWLLAFEILNIRNRFISTTVVILERVTEPFLRPIRRFLPRIEGIDFSPVILLLLIFFLDRFIYHIYPAGF